MGHRSARLAGAAAFAVCALMHQAALIAQEIPDVPPTKVSACPNNNPVAIRACAREQIKTFTPARTPDGKPDLSGY